MTDLCLNNAAHPKSPSKLSLGLAKYFEKDGQPHKTRTLEERRAYLGVFYLTSMYADYHICCYYLFFFFFFLIDHRAEYHSMPETLIL